MADYKLKQRNNRRAVYDFGDPAAPIPIQIDVNSGGGPGSVSIEVPLPFPEYSAGGEGRCFVDADFLVTPLGDDAENASWSWDILNVAQAQQTGYITLLLYNTTVGNQGEKGNFTVAVNLHT
jgi:hypothetical protein